MLNKIGYKRVIVTIVFIVVILVCGFFAIKEIQDPKNIYMNSLSKLSSSIFSTLKNNQSSLTNFIKNNDKISVDMASRIEILENSQMYTTQINSQYVENKRNKRTSLVFNSRDSINEQLNFEMQFKNNQLYTHFNQDENSYVSDFNYQSFLNYINFPNVDFLGDILIQEIGKELLKAQFKDSKETIYVDGKNQNLRKISVSFNEKMIVDIFHNTLLKLKNDDRKLKSLMDTFSLTSEDIDKYVKLLEEYKTSSSKTIFSLNIYIEHINQPLLYEIIYNDTVIKYSSYRNVELIEYYLKNENIFSLKFVKNRDKTVITGSLYELFTLEGEYSKSSIHTDLDLMFSLPDYNEEKQFVSFSYETDIKEIVTNLEYEVSNVISYDINLKKVKDIGMKVKMNALSNYKSKENVLDFNMEESIIYDSLTEEEKNILKGKVVDYPLYSKFKTVLSLFQL